MTNGPNARLAEIVINTLPRSRTRHDVHRQPHYYALRNHLLDFLVDRSRSFAAGCSAYDPRSPPIVRPGIVGPGIVGPGIVDPAIVARRKEA
jgi:nitrate/nitrite transport system ATP-binding protein